MHVGILEGELVGNTVPTSIVWVKDDASRNSMETDDRKERCDVASSIAREPVLTLDEDVQS